MLWAEFGVGTNCLGILFQQKIGSGEVDPASLNVTQMAIFWDSYVCVQYSLLPLETVEESGNGRDDT